LDSPKYEQHELAARRSNRLAFDLFNRNVKSRYFLSEIFPSSFLTKLRLSGTTANRRSAMELSISTGRRQIVSPGDAVDAGVTSLRINPNDHIDQIDAWRDRGHIYVNAQARFYCIADMMPAALPVSAPEF
jgi:hypothetical protein